METQPIWKTLTFWFNVISAALLIIALPEFTALLPEQYIKFVVFLQGAGNIALRYLTGQAGNVPVRSMLSPKN